MKYFDHFLVFIDKGFLKMQKKLTTLLLLCFGLVTMLAQSVTISDDFSIRNDNGYEILGKYRDYTLLFREKEDAVDIVAFDEQMRIKWQKPLGLDLQRSQMLDAIGNKEYFSLIYKTKTKTSNVIKICRYDANAAFIDSLTLQKERASSLNFRSIYSENKKTVLIYGIENNAKIDATVIDLDNMKILWQKSLNFKEYGQRLEQDNIIITNKGLLYLVIEGENNGGLFSSNNLPFYFIKLDGGTNQTFSHILNDHTIYNYLFKYDNKNEQLVGYAAASEKNKNRITGTLLLQQLLSEQPKITFHYFDEETLAAITGKKTAVNKGLSDIVIQEIAFRKDGGVVAIFEEYRKYARNMGSMAMRPYGMGDPGLGRMTVDYYYDGIIAVSTNPDGTKQWEKVLSKKQFSQDDDGVFSSYGLLKTPSGLRFIFNDEIKNETTTSEYVLVGSGEADRHNLFNTAKQNISLRFRDGLQVASEEFIVPSEHRGHLRLVRIRF